MTQRRVWISLAAVLVVLVGLQLVPVERTNPPEREPLKAPAMVARQLRVACGDCHSHLTRWPWYSRVAPMSWLIAHDVKEAREHLNLSTWGSYTPDRQHRLREQMWEEIEMGEMPPLLYRVAHADVRLDEDAKKLLKGWMVAPEP